MLAYPTGFAASIVRNTPLEYCENSPLTSTEPRVRSAKLPFPQGPHRIISWYKSVPLGLALSSNLARNNVLNANETGNAIPRSRYDTIMTGTCKDSSSAPYLQVKPPPAAAVSAAINGKLTAGSKPLIPGGSYFTNTYGIPTHATTAIAVLIHH